ncbi:cytoplasmic protein [Afifella marina]|uniref:Uncharacterized protein n=2 Tax=Hyphomicrobiales TaxID=356 RepID=A0A1G5MA11_AFIMA|nr:cytoplasmic protein [Afifella marina]SCZ22047.1 hypothetical protein SAMN03080610_00364 [Afifella marina DSM 2698]
MTDTAGAGAVAALAASTQRNHRSEPSVAWKTRKFGAVAAAATAFWLGLGAVAVAQDAPGPENAPPGASDDQATPEPAAPAEARSEKDGEPAQKAGQASEAPKEAAPQDPQAAAEPGKAVPEYLDVLKGEQAMPEPVRKTWEALHEAALSGDIERLRPLIEAQDPAPAFGFDNVGDPIEYLKSLSGDPEGREMLAIMLEILESDFLYVDRDSPNAMYLWPYFARYPLDRLSPQQMVQLFTLITAGDWQDIQSYGAYIFFRLGISPDGRWHFFLAGD